MSRLKSVFATTNVHLYLHVSGNTHYAVTTLENRTALHSIASKRRDCLVLYHRKINLELILPSCQYKIIVLSSPHYITLVMDPCVARSVTGSINFQLLTYDLRLTTYDLRLTFCYNIIIGIQDGGSETIIR